ncbi:MAG: DJ-1/PfpI family protein [Lachnospiraceae bacterium]|nr:DJ-1/PfpI family protein [Lachnospiraceae bacterium]
MFEQKTEKKCAIFLANGFEEIEALAVSDLLFRAGIPVVLVSLNDEPVVTSSHDVTLIADTTIAGFDFNAYDMLILPGGIPGTPNLKACAPLCDAILRFHAQGKSLAAICAAPSIFAELGILQGKTACCHPSVTEVLQAHGAIVSEENAVTCDHFITSRGMGCAIDFGLAIVTHFLGTDAAEKIAKGIVWNTTK